MKYSAMRVWLMALTMMAALAFAGCKGQSARESVAVVSDSLLRAKGYAVLTLYKTRTGHITVTMEVNGKPCVFLVDTGGGATLIDISKRQSFGLRATTTGDYAAGIGSVSSLVKTEAHIQINGHDIKATDIYLMDITYINAQFKKSRARQVDGVLGTDFLEKHGAVIDYARRKMYLRVQSSE